MSKSNPTILIVDDEPEINLVVLRTILESEGFNVIQAISGIKGREIAREKHPDLILLDIVMPEEDGYTTCKKLKEDANTANIPVIFISSMNDSSDKVKGFKYGAVDYITKPFDQDEVVARTKIHLKLGATIKAFLNSQKEKLNKLSEAQNDILIDPNDIPEASFAVYYKSLYEAGGDFYDVLKFSEDIFGYFCADVCGHDLGASLATSAFKALLPQNTGILYSASDSLRMINDVLTNILPDDKYLTALYIKLNRKKNLACIANAGHPPAIFQSITGDIKVFDQSGDMLGMYKSVCIDSDCIPVTKGDRIFLYTDGIIEYDGGEMISREAGLNRLIEAIKESHTFNLEDSIKNIINKLFPNNEKLNDDILLLGLEI